MIPFIAVELQHTVGALLAVAPWRRSAGHPGVYAHVHAKRGQIAQNCVCKHRPLLLVNHDSCCMLMASR